MTFNPGGSAFRLRFAIENAATESKRINFVIPNVTANYNLVQIQAAVAAIDAAFDVTLSDAVTAVGGSTTIVDGLSSQITASMAGASAQQQTLLVCYVLMKRAAII